MSTAPREPAVDDGDDAWAKAEGVPSLYEPFIQKYLDGRDSLVAQEKRQRGDHAFRETLSPMAAEASAIVSAIRFEEQQTLWNAQYEDNLAKQESFETYPGMMFSLAKERIESSKLWQIVKKMPKGALLHCHLEAMVDVDWLIDQALTTEGFCIAADTPLDTAERLETTPFLFSFSKNPASDDPSSIWTETYQPGTKLPVVTASSSFPNGGREAFRSWLRTRLTITHSESLQHHTGPNAIWRKFTSCFPILASIQRYEPIFRLTIRKLLSDLHADGVRWVDLRSVFGVPYTRTGSSTPDSDFEGLFTALEDEIDDFMRSPEGKNFWGARVIWTTVRTLPTRSVVENMKSCFEMKQLFPELIAGYDLVGQEDTGRTLVDLTPELFWFRKKCAEAGVEIPFYFHAGETLGDGDIIDENLFDAVLLGTRRIGHGFSLYKHPLLIDMVKEKKILVESCPVSNEVLRLTGSILSHPLPALLARGVPCALCNDDPAILGQGVSGMSHDFFQALQGWENLGLEGLGSLAENSVRWATFDDCSAKIWQKEVKDGAFGTGVRAERMKEWAKEFEGFCAWIVMEFGADNDVAGLD
ncbi:hypothetical protein LTR62_006421 [Meristemomyces frigidus]|uniref:adenosine deaminase n=1 Tax=Meristemomyces frigidus TaxID=1508187 RepID=A0AAN7TCC2_9PEZI|nr:hypothetical protein LTR62_006421 [Meristemomyces frigidus]